MTTIARTSEELRDVLSMFAGEYHPTRKLYYGSLFFGFVSGFIATPLLIYALVKGDPLDESFWESLSSAISAPLIAYVLFRLGTSHYVVDEDHVACVTPVPFGSWTIMRAELESIDVHVWPAGMSLHFKSGLQSAKSMSLRKRQRELLLRRYPEVRRAKLKASAAERAEQARGRRVLILLAIFLILLISMFVVIMRLQ